MGKTTKGRHLDHARLHAYAAGEVDPTQRSVIEAHLEICPRCRDALGRVGAVAALMQRMAPQEPDELSWRRMQDRVQKRLQADAESGVTTLDLLMGRRWVTAGLAAVAAVALLVWFAPRRRPAPRPPAPVMAEAAVEQPQAQVVTSGDAPLDVKLASGARLELAAQSRVVASSSSDGGVLLALEAGALAVRLPERPTVDEPFEVRTPAFTASSRSRDFSVGYRADRFLVAVREGEVDVEGEAFGGRDTVLEGERREVRIRDEVEAERVVVPPRARNPRPVPPPVDEIVSSSSQGETSVQVLAPDDPVAASWREASRAYYRLGDLQEAIRHAEAVVDSGEKRAEIVLARRMICDAQIALHRPRAALDACGALLENERDDEEIRTIHYMLGTIYRTQLDDCAEAMKHYEQVLVYGRRALLDDEARLFRASCALQLGDLKTAQRDIRALAPHAARLSRPAELRALELQVRAALSAQGSDRGAEDE